MKTFTVAPYKYKPGHGIQILAGAQVVATVHGTSYPTGSGCPDDHALALKMAAANDMLAALEMLIDEYGNGGMLDGTEIEAVVLAAIAKATTP